MSNADSFKRGDNGLLQLKVKQLFLAKPNHTLWELDYSQIELRVAVLYANVNWMKEAYINGDDLHHLTAEMIGSYAYFDRPGDGRQIGKMGNFLWLYDGGGLRLRESLWAQARMDIPLEQCENWTKLFRERTPEFRKASFKAKRLAEQRGYVILWNGRRRRFTNNEDSRKAWNSVIQGGAGQIMMRAMNRIRQAELHVQMANTVHDAIWFHVPDGYEDELDIAAQIMETTASEVFNNILPFKVDRKQLA